MPGMSGPEVHERLVTIKPGLAALFMSGYADPQQRSGLNLGVNFMPKPFSPDTLLKNVRQALDAVQE